MSVSQGALMRHAGLQLVSNDSCWSPSDLIRDMSVGLSWVSNVASLSPIILGVKEVNSIILGSLQWTGVHRREIISAGGKKKLQGELIILPEECTKPCRV